MPKTHNRGRTRRSGLLIVGISVLVLVGAAATFVAVRGWSAISDIFAHDKQDMHVGKIAVITTPVALPAFVQLDPAAFIDPKTGSFHIAWVTEKAAMDAGLIRDPQQLRGRVLKRDKAAGLSFSEPDFYPKGTLPGPTSAIEPGYRGVTLSTKDVDGLSGLGRFVHFDLVAVINVRASGTGNDGGVVYTPEAAAASQSAKEWKTERKTVVQNAMILVPVAAKTNMGAAQECFVAIRDEEVAPLADAIAKGAKIVAMARSGLPGGDSSQFIDQDNGPAVDSIHVISGKNSWNSYVPADSAPSEPKPEPKK
jgi:hypothetical protein